MIASRLRQAGFLLAALAWPVAGQAAASQDVVAVLSANSGPYLAAYESFQKDFGQAVATYHLPQDKPSAGLRPRVVVAFGSEAVFQPYSPQATLIVCLAPGLAARSPHGGPFSFVAMKPPAETLLQRLRALQPNLKRLAVLWSSENTETYLNGLKSSAPALGIEIIAEHVRDPGAVPDVLRGVLGKADALWLAPDPSLVTPEVFQTIKQFSWDNAVPFYAPTSGLVAAGAAAAVSVSFEEMGRQAAEMARKALAGRSLPQLVYPVKTELTVNVESAAKAGLKVAPEALGQADKVIR